MEIFTLSSIERFAFENACQKCFLDEKLSSVPVFWGKIFGLERNYLIARQFASSFGQIRKNFFIYNPNLASLDKLPPVSDRSKKFAPLINEQFSGDPTKLVKVFEEVEKTDKKVDDSDAVVAADADAAADADVVEEPALPELERLAFVVAHIDDECAAVPRGALQLTAAKEVVIAPDFAGLTVASAMRLDSYAHFRDSRSEAVRARLSNALYHFKGDFLDSLSGDQPKGVWSLRLNATQTAVELRSLLWPGFFSAHTLHTTQFNAAYFGNGLRQGEVAFLL